MPIVEIENALESLPFGAGLPKIADIRKGTRDEASGRMDDLDHFRVVFPDMFAHLAPLFVAKYGPNPVQIHNAFLVGETRQQAFTYWMEEHTKTRMLHQCDGQTQHKHYEPSIGKISAEPIACAAPECKCRYTGRMIFLLPDFSMETGYMGYFMLHTGSFWDIKSINGHLRDVELMNGDRVSGIPLTIYRAPTKISRPNPKKPGERMRTPAWLVHLMVSPGYTRNVFAPGISQTAYAIAAGELTPDGEVIEQPALPAGDTSTSDWDDEHGGDYDEGEGQFEELPDEVPGMETLPEPAQLWDWDAVGNRTSHMFDHQDHQENAFRKMIAAGELKPEMTDDEAVVAIGENRRRRTAEKVREAEEKAAAGDAPWNADNKNVAAFIAAAQKRFNLNFGQVVDALNRDSAEKETINGIQDYHGNKERAWACCIAMFAGYSIDKLAAVPLDDATRALVTEVIRTSLQPF